MPALCPWAHGAQPAPRCANAAPELLGSCLLLGVLRGAQAVEDLLAGGTHGELLGITSRHPHLPAQRHHGLSGHGALHDLVLANVMREALMVTRLADLLFDLLTLDHRS